jgi:broad specificity phosphatase PhoE
MMFIDENNYLPNSICVRQPGTQFFVRHGQCRSNTEWPIEGYKDHLDPLTELGKRQSDQCGRFLTSLLPGVTWRIYSSTLLRARQTAEIISAHTSSVMVGTDERLIEFSSSDDGYLDCLGRLKHFLEEVDRLETKDHERNLFVTHGHVLEFVLRIALKADLTVVGCGADHGAGVVSHANGGISALYKRRLLLWNAQMHLLPDEAQTMSVTCAGAVVTREE